MRTSVMIIGFCLLSGCSSGGGSSSAPPPTPTTPAPAPTDPTAPQPVPAPRDWAELIAEDPSGKGVSDLQEIYRNYIWELAYQGLDQPAEISAQSVQTFARYLDSVRYSHFPYFDRLSVSELRMLPFKERSSTPADPNAPFIDFAYGTHEVDGNISCVDERGSSYLSGWITDGKGTLAVEYKDCDAHNHKSVNGSGAVVVNALRNVFDDMLVSRFLNGVTYYSDQMGAINYWGYDIKTPIPLDPNTTTQTYRWHNERLQLVQVEAAGVQYVADLLSPAEPYEVDDQINYTGKLALSDHGTMEVALEPGNLRESIYWRITFSGADQAKAYLEEDVSGVALRVDLDADGIAEMGRYFINWWEFIENDFSLKPLLPAAAITQPPFFNRWELRRREVDDAIEATLNIWDYDTEQEALVIRYTWAVDDVVIDGVNEPVLPNEYLGDNNSVTLLVEVSDGDHTVNSEQFINYLRRIPR